MSPGGRRSRDQAQATRTKLLDAASRIFARDGYEAATVEDIVKDAGYSKGAFYVHFQTKEEVFLALLDGYVAGQQRPRHGGEQLSPQALYDALLRLVQPDPVWPTLFYEFCAHAARNRAVAERLARLFQAWRGAVSDALRQGQGQGLVDPALDTDMAAAVLVAVAGGVPLQGRVDPQVPSSEGISAALAGLLGAWLQPRAGPPAPALAVPGLTQAAQAAPALDYDAVAEAYERHLDRTTGPFVAPLLEMARLRSGQRVLDVATGTGAVARRAARLVGPAGYVLGVDRAPGMLDVARRAARSLGVSNLEFREMDAASLPLPDASFDVVLCAMALAEFPAADRALREMARVLSPGGRLVVSTWSTADRVALEGMIERAAARHLPAAGGPSPFAYGVPQALEAALAKTGLREVAVRRVKHTLELNSREEVWETARGASPRLHALLRQADAGLRDAVRRDILAEAERCLIGGRFRLTSEAVLGAGVR